MAISPDGRILYVPPLGLPYWYVVNAEDGSVLQRIDRETSPHNTIISDDGRRGYLASQGQGRFIGVTDMATHAVIQEIGPFSDRIRPFTIDGRQTLIFVNVNNLLGFEVADLTSGQVIHRVEVEGFPTVNSRFHGCPSHGIAMTADESEIWMTDSGNHYLHVFDATVMPPRQKTSISLRDEPGWITFGFDGRLAYPSTGEVIDVDSKQIVATLEDETGQQVQSEKILQIDFADGRPLRVSDQFGKGAVR